jgi:solute carrier family 25 (mitochondrial oxoglutarate transporter), member 11
MIKKKFKNQFSLLMDKYIIGAMSGITATFFVQPIDRIKVEIQLNSSKKYSENIRSIINNGGIREFYKGIDVAVLRQSIYGTTRLGMFQDLKDNYKVQPLVASTIAATTATILNNPIDYWLLNKQTNPDFSILRTVSEKGIRPLYSGLKFNIIRAVTINVGFGVKPYLDTYFGSKTDNTYLSKFASNSISSIGGSILSFPFDVMRTYSYKSIDSLPPMNYFFKSYPVFALRIVPHAFISMTCLDMYSRLYSKHFKNNH